jgi:hypothetical protein
MPITPKPFKFVCCKCSFSKLVLPKSDVLNFSDIDDTCPKCKNKMTHKGLSLFDYIATIFR